MGRFSVLVLMVVVVVAQADEQCDDCNKQTWINGADSDPHVAVRLPNSKLDRPICYDLDGKDGEVLSLYEFKQGETELTVSGQLVASPRSHNHGATYFGKFIFTTDVNEVEITPTTIVVRRIADNSTQTFPWRRNVLRSHPTFFADEAQNFTVEHWQRKVVKVTIGDSIFEVKKNYLRYGREKKDFYFLGIYLVGHKSETFGGLIGEIVGNDAFYRKEGRHNMIVFDGKSIEVIDKNQNDLLNNRIFRCWQVQDVAQLLKHPRDFYLRRRL